MFVDPVAIVIDQTFSLDGANKISQYGNRDNQAMDKIEDVQITSF